MTQTLDLDRASTIGGLLAEYGNYRALLETLSPADLVVPTRCDGWQVRDVLGHVIGLASDSFGGRVGRFTPDEQAAMRRDLTVADLADELDHAVALGESLAEAIDDDAWHGPSGAPDLTLGEGVITLWSDAWVHRDDINAALGRPSDSGPGLAASVEYLRWALAKRGWTTDRDLGAVDPHQFVLAATGRLDPAQVGLDPSVNIYA